MCGGSEQEQHGSFACDLTFEVADRDSLTPAAYSSALTLSREPAGQSDGASLTLISAFAELIGRRPAVTVILSS